MNEKEFEEYISAFVDMQYTGLTEREVRFLMNELEQHPQILCQMNLDRATKLCLEKHLTSKACPKATADVICGIIYHLYRSRQATISQRNPAT